MTTQQTRFLDVRSFNGDQQAVAEAANTEAAGLRSPFLAVYGSEEAGGLIDPQAGDQVVFLNELYDDEFEEALFALASEATALYEARIQHEGGDPGATSYDAERLLNQHFAPLVSEANAMLDSFARDLGRRDTHGLTQDEITAVIERYQPSQDLLPSFEEFLGKLKKVVKKVAGAAVDVAKKGISAAATAGLGPILEKLKALVKPLLQRVVQTAIGKLPAPLQPHARKLAERLPLLKELDEGDEPHAASAETCGIARIQYEFNHNIANLLFAHDEVELELEMARVEAEQRAVEHHPLADLDRARAQFEERLLRLHEGEDPTPHVEEFIPAILPALKLGIQLAGRKRVVNFLADLVGKLIQRFVGPQYAPALSQAIVDAGLRLIQLEAGRDDDARAAASAVVATVEETVRRVTDLPDHVLDNDELFEGLALLAFEQAAAANLPAVLPESTYRRRPDLAEARKLRGTWLMMPRGRRRRFKKFSRKLTTRLTPHKVATLESFEGIPLEEFLEEELGVAPGEEVEAVVHLYESIAGTHLPDIARLDDAPGLGVQDGYQQLHPLTPTAAGVLLGEPELGREVDPRYLVDEHTTAVGQRFYYLEVPGHRPLTVPQASRQVRKRLPTHLRLVLDFPKNEIRLRLFLSEIRAQELAVKLRQHAHIGAAVAQLQRYLDRGLRSSLTGAFARLKLVHEAVTPDLWVAALRRLPSIVPQMLRSRLQEWALSALADYLKRQPQEFIQAAEDTADGVTLLLTIGSPPGFPQLREALKGRALSLADLKLSGTKPSVKVQAVPGHADE
jgi:hypothetical protein